MSMRRSRTRARACGPQRTDDRRLRCRARFDHARPFAHGYSRSAGWGPPNRRIVVRADSRYGRWSEPPGLPTYDDLGGVMLATGLTIRQPSRLS